MLPNIRRTRPHLFASLAITLLIHSNLGLAIASDEVQYARDIQPLLTKYCAGCHNDDDAESDFSVSSFASLMSGVDLTPVVISGDAAHSPLLNLMSGLEEPKMPPEDEPQPTEDELEMIRSWIESGAKGSEVATSNMVLAKRLQTPKLPPANASLHHVTATLATPRGILVGQLGTLRLLPRPDAEQAIWENAQFAGKINSLRLSADGVHAVVGSGIAGIGGEIGIVNLETGDIIDRFQGHRDTVYCASLSPNGKRLASGSYDRRILIWNVESGEVVAELKGHNGAIYDLDFDPSGTLLATASADQTVKLWNVETGQRLDTLGQPEGEMLAVRFGPQGNAVFASGADRQIRKWKIVSRTEPGINPMLVARYAHESEISQLEISGNGLILSASTDLTAKAWDPQLLEPLGTLTELEDTPIGLCVLRVEDGGATGFVTDLRGHTREFSLSGMTKKSPDETASKPVRDAQPSSEKTSSPASEMTEQEPNDQIAFAGVLSLPAVVQGTIHTSEPEPATDTDLFRFQANAGEAWIIEANSRGKESSIDPMIDVLDPTGGPVLRTRLQAVRESYFTFRGKDSSTSDDFRLHKWEDMELDEFLYAGGEVNRLWLYPRGPDSGFKVYPGSGARHAFFGTTPVSHALGDVTYIVRELAPGETPLPNGLPVFPIYYENDDDGLRRSGKNARLEFTAPETGEYLLRVRDARGFSGESLRYEVSVRKPKPDFTISVSGNEMKMPLESGREWKVEAKRLDGLDSPIEIYIENLPPGMIATNPLIIESGQQSALGTIYVTDEFALNDETTAQGDEAPEPSEVAASSTTEASNTGSEVKTEDVKEAKPAPNLELKLTARSTFYGQEIVREVNKPLKLWIQDRNEKEIQLRLVSAQDPTFELEELQIRPGETISAKILVQRRGEKNRISFGKEDSGRNLPHGAFVDNIGLNGLLIPETQAEREFFITAAPKLKPGRRQFHIRSETSGKPTSKPIWLHVVSP
ncbi:MAG: c-type cytochrome domain-containing protein [Aureliella sp.]